MIPLVLAFIKNLYTYEYELNLHRWGANLDPLGLTPDRFQWGKKDVLDIDEKFNNFILGEGKFIQESGGPTVRPALNWSIFI